MYIFLWLKFVKAYYLCKLMHTIEPYYNWRGLYIASEDERSPFFDRVYSEFEYTDAIYNYCIHPQWDSIESTSLFIKILYCDYHDGYVIIELFGEWNDTLYNDIMTLKRDIIELLMQEGIYKFILIGENLLNFHASDDCYYEEWFDDVEDEDGWIAFVNFRDHVMDEFESEGIDSYIVSGGDLEDVSWRTNTPKQFYDYIKSYVKLRLG